MSARERDEMTSETLAVPGLLLMLAAVALAALELSMAVVAVPLGLSLLLAVCAGYQEVLARRSRQARH